MRKHLALIAVLAAIFTVVIVSQSDAEKEPIGKGKAAQEKADSLPPGCTHAVTASQARGFIKAVWSESLWERGMPPKKTLEAYATKLHCAAGPGHRHAIKHQWRALKKAYFAHRADQMFRVKITPYAGGGQWWAIPYYIVVCESGGRVNDPAAPNGAYSLLTGPLQGVPTWESWRPGWASGYAAPYEAPKKAQDIAAHRLWATYGSEPWECA